MARLSTLSLTHILKQHTETLAAATCGLLVLLGWLALQSNWTGVALCLLLSPILSAVMVARSRV